MVSFKTKSIALICTVYSVSSFLQRHHLFVWSVFAPRLIYQLFHLIIELTICIFTITFIYIFQQT
jgi:hypothetical protein